MNALVTGGAGFIGSTLVDRLLAEGHSVVVVDNLVSGKESNLAAARATSGDRLAFHQADIRDAETQKLIAGAGAEVVFHLAAQMDVRVSVADPVYDAQVNIIGALNVLEGARAGEARKVVFASSGVTIYGEVPDADLPIKEHAPQRPLSPYGISKKAFGDYLFAYGTLHGLASASLALGNVFGPRQDPHGEAGVVAIFGERLLKGEECKVFGDGSATRDYVYVDDVVDAFMRAAGAGSGIYNIGTGIETSTKGLYTVMAEAAGVNKEPIHAPARTGEIERSALDYGRAKSDLGWEPATLVPEGVVNVLDYIRAHSA